MIANRPTTSTSMVLYGATGDLAARLLFPALCRLERAGRLDTVEIIGVGLEDWTVEEFKRHLETRLRDIAGDILDGWHHLEPHVSYHPAQLTPDSLAGLSSSMRDINIHYLALPPTLFARAATAIAAAELAPTAGHRLVIEKPFGTDLQTAAALDAELHQLWEEKQIFRIDHFLGKETVQNLSVTRFANRIIEPLLCATHVDLVQITAAETLGIEGRYRYYDGIGALRDMVQNHLMQLLSLAAMEPPSTWDPEVLRDHKVELLQSVRHVDTDVSLWAARGQYIADPIDPELAVGYREEDGIDASSTTETFAAIAVHIDNWRWEGVPFYLRSGKRLRSKVSEIAYRFRKPPTDLFRHSMLADTEPNWLVFRLDEPEGIDLSLQTKTPGLAMESEPSRLHTDYGDPRREHTAYEQLLVDVIDGDHTPFLRVDEVAEAWRIIDPVLGAWRSGEPESYRSGSDGPASQARILEPGHVWRPI